MRFNISTLLILITIGIASCKKSGNPPDEKKDVVADNPNVDVYIGGSDGNYLAAIWKNGEKISLHNSTATYSTVNAIAVNGSDVYAAGSYQIGSTPSISIACYWKNGVLHSIGNPSISSYATGIAIDGNDVYVTGNTNTQGLFWKNGIINQLANNNAIFSSAESVFIKDRDVYIAGSVSPFTRNACYWKNGVLTVLSTKSSVANAIALNGNDVYVAGDDVINGKPTSALFWKNGTSFFLGSENASSSSGNAIAFKNNDIYIAGYAAINAQPIAVYWKNGTMNKPSNAVSFRAAFGIATFGNDVYVVGGGNLSGSATIWKNDSQVQLDQNGSVAKSIAVVKRP